jgi:hypothetical protein
VCDKCKEVAKSMGQERGMRRFILDRVEDVSGVSGTGKVAEGVEFSTGKVAVTWVTEHRSTTVYDSMAEVEAIHGHGGRTVIKYLDLSPEMEKVSKKIADGIEAGLKSGLRQVSPIELALAKLETAGAKGALYQSEKERVKLELELAELIAAVERQDTLLGKMGNALADANDRSIAYQGENERLTKRLQREHMLITSSGYQWSFGGVRYVMEPHRHGMLKITKSKQGCEPVVVETTIERWFTIGELCGPVVGLEGSIEAQLQQQKEEIERLTYNLWAIEKIAAPAA